VDDPRFFDTAPVDYFDLHRAVRGCDDVRLRQLALADPVTTLAFLDVSMRGLASGYAPMVFEAVLEEDDVLRAHVEWIVRSDAALREELGWRVRDADVEIMRAPYMAGDLVLVVGAGASMAAGLPGWADLVIRTLRRALWHGSAEHRDEARHAAQKGGVIGLDGSTYLLPTGDSDADRAEREKWAENVELRALSAEQRKVAQATVDALTSTRAYTSEHLLAATAVAREFWGEAFNHELGGVLRSYTVYRNRLHPAIARMVRPKEDAGLTPRVWAIVTYNFDTLIESAVYEAGQGFTVTWSEGGEPRATRGLDLAHLPNAVEIHHVHGLVPTFPFPRDPGLIDLVFTAEHYQRAYGEADNWIPTIQSAVLGNSPTLTIGSSLTDDYAVAQLAAHHKRRPWWFHAAAMVLPEDHRADPASLDAGTLRQLNAPYEALGLRVLWMSGHDELPDLLDEIRTEPADRAARRAAEGMMRQAEAAHEAGNLEAEIAGLEGAMAHGGTLGSRAAYNLGLLRLELESPAAGVPLLRMAMDSNDREWSALAAAVLGDVLAQSGQPADARRAYEHCLMTGHEPALATARAGLDRLARGAER